MLHRSNLLRRCQPCSARPVFLWPCSTYNHQLCLLPINNGIWLETFDQYDVLVIHIVPKSKNNKLNSRGLVTNSNEKQINFQRKNVSHTWIPVKFSEYDQGCCSQCDCCIASYNLRKMGHLFEFFRNVLYIRITYAAHNMYLSKKERPLGRSFVFENDRCMCFVNHFELYRQCE